MSFAENAAELLVNRYAQVKLAESLADREDEREDDERRKRLRHLVAILGATGLLGGAIWGASRLARGASDKTKAPLYTTDGRLVDPETGEIGEDPGAKPDAPSSITRAIERYTPRQQALSTGLGLGAAVTGELADRHVFGPRRDQLRAALSRLSIQDRVVRAPDAAAAQPPGLLRGALRAVTRSPWAAMADPRRLQRVATEFAGEGGPQRLEALRTFLAEGRSVSDTPVRERGAQSVGSQAMYHRIRPGGGDVTATDTANFLDRQADRLDAARAAPRPQDTPLPTSVRSLRGDLRDTLSLLGEEMTTSQRRDDAFISERAHSAAKRLRRLEAAAQRGEGIPGARAGRRVARGAAGASIPLLWNWGHEVIRGAPLEAAVADADELRSTFERAMEAAE